MHSSCNFLVDHLHRYLRRHPRVAVYELRDRLSVHLGYLEALLVELPHGCQIHLRSLPLPLLLRIRLAFEALSEMT